MIKNNYTILTIIFFAFSYASLAQDVINISGHEDCATRLEIETRKVVGPTNAPSGYGAVQEFVNNAKEDLYHIEDEHHSV